MQLIRFLGKPHPFIFNRWSVVIPGLVTFFIIGLLAPLGLQEIPLSKRLLFALCIGGVISLSVWGIVTLLKQLFPHRLNAENWTVLKEVFLFVIVLFIIDVIIFFLVLLFNFTAEGSSWGDIFFTTLLYTFSIGIFPIVIIALFEQYNHQKNQLIKAKKLSKDIPQKSSILSTHLLRLKAENGKLGLQLTVGQILYLKSDGNYVEVIYLNNTIQKKLIRNRLKAVAEFLPATSFFQCHKSYIVNIRNIIRVEGNARNFELFLKGLDTAIPVSRAKSEELQQRIAQN